MIILNNNNHNNNKIKHLKGKKTIIIIYYIEIMKRLPCLICSVNIKFSKTNRGTSL